MPGETMITHAGMRRRAIREDAVKLRNPDRWYVPTSKQTKWVSNMEEFRAAGGMIVWDEDQTSLELLLPEPFKFGIKFFDEVPPPKEGSDA